MTDLHTRDGACKDWEDLATRLEDADKDKREPTIGVTFVMVDTAGGDR